MSLQKIELSAAEYVRALWPAISTALGMVFTVMLLKQLMSIHWQLGVRPGFEVSAGVTVYLLTLLVFYRKLLQAFLKFSLKMRRPELGANPV